MSKLKVISLFSGVGAFEKALTNMGIGYELVGFSEIDKWAIQSYCAIHEVDESLNLGDISRINEQGLPNADLITYGFPCQDISVAGKGAGINKDTDTGLLYEAERIIKHVKPKYAIAENVRNLIGSRYKEDFNRLLDRLNDYGYNSYWAVLNAKNFNVPQNRERVFIVSIRKDLDDETFKFPTGEDSGARLEDVLSEEVQDKYYINREIQLFKEPEGELHKPIRAGFFEYPNSKKQHQSNTFYNSKGISPTVDTAGGGNREPKILESVIAASRGRYKNGSNGETKQNIEVNKEGLTNTITTVQKDNWVLERESQPEGNMYTYQIRKLEPLECWRLMGFEDKDYWVARRRLEKVFYNGGDRSNSQMYKQAGNSIVVDVLEEIFKNLLL